MIPKNRYEQALWTYLKRREDLRKQYGEKWRKNPEYSKRVMLMSRRIDSIKGQIKRIERRNETINQIGWAVQEFLCIPSYPSNKAHKSRLHFSIKRHEKEFEIARQILYKYGMENGIQGVFISAYVGAKDPCTASRGRLSFTRSFVSKPENRELWHRFKNFIKEQGFGVEKFCLAA